jgi:TIR domain
MTDIFISYRQADSKAWAIALRDDLARVFGENCVFLDKDTLHAGNWREQIQHALEHCKVVLVVIGSRWLTIADEHHRPRIQLTDDVHHQEIAFVLSRSDVTVIPVLVDDAPMPRADELPSDLRKLTYHQARKIGDTQARRRADLAVLVNDIQSVSGLQPRAQTSAQDVPVSQTVPVRIARLRPKMTTLYIAFALTVVAGMYAYLKNSPMDVPQLLFLLLVFCALVFAVRSLWGRVQSARRGERE